jgi:hypothetical protein
VFPYFKDFAVVVVTLVIRECGPPLVRAYRKRFVDPKKAHQQVFVDRANWYNERAAKLGAFHHHLGRESTADEFKLAGLVSKLDEQDRQWAMKQTDIELLRKYAVEKAAECRDNAGRCVRSAEEVGFKIFW